MSEQTAFSISVVPPLDDERAVTVARQALIDAAAKAGWELVGDDEWPAERQIVVKLRDGVEVAPFRPAVFPSVEEQSYSIRSAVEGDRGVVTIEAGGALGATFALSRIADSIRSACAWPPADIDERPRFAQRLSFVFMSYPSSDEAPYIDMDAALVRLEQAIALLDETLLTGGTAVQVLGSRNLFKWGDEKLDERADACREVFGELIAAAHERRLLIYSMDDEFLYEPAWFESTGATFSTDDARFWDALTSKYRDLLEALPHLDGIGTRTGEVTPQGRILAWDLIHTPDDRSIEGNYRRFLTAMHGVVVGEFGRQYLHRTWTVNTWEQSSVPEIFRRTFTEDIPMENFIASIKTTTGDQWEWQPINPTFGQTPHTTAAQVETSRAQDYFSGPPDFSAEFSQAGLEYALEHGATVAGVNLRDRWQKNLWAALDFVTWRLGWNPYQSVRKLTAEWVAAQIDPKVADRVAEMLLDFNDIYRDGFHIRGPAYHTWEPLVHVRTGFICKGNPLLDNGRGQYRFLRDLYLQAKPELESGLQMMDDATKRFDRWFDDYRRWLHELDEPERGDWMIPILQWGSDILRLNLAYVSAFLRFFDFADAARAGGDTRYRDRAVAAIEELESELENFRASRAESDYNPAFPAAENVQGIDVFLSFAKPGIDDLAGVITSMRNAPDEAAVRRMYEEARERDTALLEKHEDAQVLVRWNGRIDSRDVFRFGLKDGTLVTEHYLGDGGATDSWTGNPRPAGAGRVALRVDRGADRGWAWVLEEPNEANNETLAIQIDDNRPGYGSYEVTAYWIAE